MAHNTHIADIYRRLRSLGFDSDFVRSVILPDWWEDSMAEIPLNRAWAEASVARFLRLQIPELADPTAPLTLPAILPVRLKSAKRTSDVSLIRPAIQVAQRLADLLVQTTSHLAPFVGVSELLTAHQELRTSATTVTLKTLIEFCWEHGVIVAHIGRLPKVEGFRKFDGLAMFVNDRPIILLADPSDIPPWQAFHLAHELGHIVLEHVKPGSEVLADGELDQIVTDDVEAAADRFACEILTGQPELSFEPVFGLTASKLAAAVTSYGEKTDVDPGIVALIYGRTASRWPAAVAALKLLGLRHGAKEIIGGALAAHLDFDSIHDSQVNVLEQLVLPSAVTA